MNWEKTKIKDKEIKEVLIENDEVVLKTKDELSFRMSHSQDCCECVTIQRFDSIDRLKGSVILDYEEKVTDVSQDSYDSATKTEFIFQTSKGVWSIEWLGESNGYYSEGVDFDEIK